MEGDLLYKFEFKKKNLGIALFLLGIVYLVIASYYGLKFPGLWHDEIYTQAIVNISFSQMLERGISNVHPLGYYIGLKLFKKLCFMINFTDVEAISIIFSLIPMYLLYILSATKIRKNFGLLTAGIFSLCIISMPILMKYATEVRMYSWGLFFVTICFLYMWEIKKNSNFKNWALFTIFTICSAYTHYFTAVTCGVMYLIIFLYVFKDKVELKKWVLSVIMAILAYSSWIPYAFSQVTSVSSDYWIDPITLETILNYFYFMFNPMTQIVPNSMAHEFLKPKFEILGLILILSLLALLVLYIINRNDLSEEARDKNNFAILGWIIVVAVPAIGVIISLIKTPVFYMRYLVPLLGILWLGFSILLEGNYDKKKIFYPILIIVLVIGVVSTVNFIDYSQNAHDFQSYDRDMVLNEIPDGSAIITNDYHIKLLIESYAKNPQKFYKKKPTILGNVEDSLDSKKIEGKRIFVISNESDLNFTDLNVSVVQKKPFVYDDTLYEIVKN